MALGTGVGQENTDLTVLDPSRGPRPVGQRSKYWRATPADRVPFFKNPVSSMISTPSGAPRCSTT
jgi:hypothetical protein